jgi:osmotically-inducible protein OsmY
LKNPAGASGPGYTAADEEISEGEEVYVPPTDPVRSADNEVLGGFATTSMDEIPEVRGDEDMRDAILTELRKDATTTDLEIQVQVRRGIVRLRGRVNDLQDAENAAAVAERIPGVIEVLDELDLAVQ